jgi:hypothetical protein
LELSTPNQLWSSRLRYLLIVAIWLTLSVPYGLVGTTIGPGIVMLMVALFVGVIGSTVSLIQRFRSYNMNPLYSGFIVGGSSIALTVLFFSSDNLTYQSTLFLGVFVFGLSFVGSFVVDRFAVARAR